MTPVAERQLTATRSASGPRLDYHHLAGDAQLTGCGLAGVDVLYRRHHPMVYRYCLGVLRTPDAAADAGQSTWVQVAAALATPTTVVGNVRPWLRTIARNECFDLLRARGGVQTVDISALDIAGGATAEDLYESREQLQGLLEDLQTLSERQRSAIVLRELCGLGSEELAALFDTTPKRASGLVADARRTLTQRQIGRELPCEQVRHALTHRPASIGLLAHLHICTPCRDIHATSRAV